VTRLVRRASLLVALYLLAVATLAASAGGWYLLAPPWRTAIRAGKDELDTTAPLTKWEQMGAFDTARICENSKVGIVQWLEKGDKERLDRAAKSYLQHPSSDPLQTKEGENYARGVFAAARARASRCVSVSDPRLK
jgi:hypothetical protein